MKTKLNAPRSVGSTSSAAASTDRSGRLASSVVTSAVSEVVAGSVEAALGDLAGQLGGVDQVAVVGQRDRRAGGRGPDRGLRVFPGRAAGGGVPGVADRQVAAQAGQRRLVEDLGDQAEILVDHHAGAVADRDAGGFLAAVLECVEPEVGELRDLFPGRPDTEDAAGILRAGLLGVEIVGQPAVASGHLLLLAACAVGSCSGQCTRAPLGHECYARSEPVTRLGSERRARPSPDQADIRRDRHGCRWPGPARRRPRPPSADGRWRAGARSSDRSPPHWAACPGCVAGPATH